MVAIINRDISRPVRIVVLDSGIDTSIIDVAKYVKVSTGFIIDKNGFIVEKTDMLPSHNHGSIIAIAILQICKDIELISINILDNKLTTDGRILIHAFRHALSYCPDIINMSLGTLKWRYKLELWKIVRQAIKQNTIIVAAMSNTGLRTYPASINGVVGVRGDMEMDYKCYRYENGYFYTNSYAGGISGVDKIMGGVKAGGNSISTALMTGHIAKLMLTQGNHGVRQILANLKHAAKSNTRREFNEQ